MKEAFKKISRISEWWAKEVEGKSEEADDVFTVCFKNGDMYKVKVSEMIPTEKIIWEVIDSYQGWHNDHTEWVGTKIVWEVFPKAESIEVKMTHEGLVPEFECFDQCRLGWDYFIGKSLFNLLTSNKGMPV